MRAKMRCLKVEKYGDIEKLNFCAVGPKGSYPADGSDEDNSYARWSPSASLEIHVANPALHGKIKAMDTFYVDFTPVDS